MIVQSRTSFLMTLIELGDRTKNSWIFLNQKLVSVLIDTSDNYEWLDDNLIEIEWVCTKEFSHTCITIKFPKDEKNRKDKYYAIQKIESNDIAFKYMPPEPSETFFFEM